VNSEQGISVHVFQNCKFAIISVVYIMTKVFVLICFQVYGYARKFAKIGIAEALVDSLSAGLSSCDLVSACTTLKVIAVNVSGVLFNPTLSTQNCVCIGSS